MYTYVFTYMYTYVYTCMYTCVYIYIISLHAGSLLQKSLCRRALLQETPGHMETTLLNSSLNFKAPLAKKPLCAALFCERNLAVSGTLVLLP